MNPLLNALIATPAGARLALVLNAAGVFGILAYALGQGHLAWMYFTRAYVPPKAPPLPEHPADYPIVTVQVPMYNERYVAVAVMDACAALDWPRERLELQILDDSVDDTVAIVDARAAHWRAQGLDVQVVRRAERVGFKAGALAHGAQSARGEFHALFDADFRPPADFLRRTIPHFADPRVGAVQARWGHLNRTWSWLTRAQALVIDAFFVLEQEARHRAGLFVRFNGSAGVWRATTVADAGGWTADTLSEDLDLAYRSQMRGWRFVYLRDVVAPAELPVTVHDYKVQQTRWARGRGQVIRKLLPRLWRTPLPRLVKAHALFDLLNIFVVPAVLLTAITSPWLILALDVHPELRHAAAIVGLIAQPFNVALIVIFVWHGLRIYAATTPALAREALRTVPAFLALTLGINLVMITACISGLRGTVAPFQRTSKYNLKQDGGTLASTPYRPMRVAPITWTEGLLAAFFVASLALDIAIGAWVWIPFHIFLTAGFAAMFVLSVRRT